MIAHRNVQRLRMVLMTGSRTTASADEKDNFDTVRVTKNVWIWKCNVLQERSYWFPDLTEF